MTSESKEENRTNWTALGSFLGGLVIGASFVIWASVLARSGVDMNPVIKIVVGCLILVAVFLRLINFHGVISVKDGDETYRRALSWRNRLSLFVNGKIYVGLRSGEDWEGGKAPHFIFKCKVHGYVVSYPHGWEEELRCPECEPEYLERMKKAGE